MRILAISDIHGCSRALIALAKFAAFSADDTVITLGDYVDKGPASRQVIDWLIAYQAQAPLVALRGNHDILMLASRQSKKEALAWMDQGGAKTLASYAPGTQRPGSLDDVPADHWKFLEATARYHEEAAHFFVHATVLADVPLPAQSDFSLFWDKFRDPLPHQSGKVMVCGHTSQRSFEPLNLGHAICIDTRCFGGGWLTCFDVLSGRLWQANQRGDTQTGNIAQYRSSSPLVPRK